MCRIARRPMTWEEVRVQLHWMDWLQHGVTVLLLVFLAMHIFAWLLVNLLMAALTGVAAASMYLCRHLISDESDRIRGDYLLGQHPELMPKLDPDDLD